MVNAAGNCERDCHCSVDFAAQGVISMKVKRPELSFLKKIFLVDLIKGLLLTFSYQSPSKNYTEQYPKVRPKVAERFRGAPRLNNDPHTGETLCIACNLCALACPE